jgi:hypothetical protein
MHLGWYYGSIAFKIPYRLSMTLTGHYLDDRISVNNIPQMMLLYISYRHISSAGVARGFRVDGTRQ